jgi:hypothetical protein
MVYEFTSSVEGRAGYGNGLEVRELVERFVTAIRLVDIGWVAAPLAIEYSNLPWQEPRDYPLNQNLPWAGFFTLTPNAAASVQNYWAALGEPVIAPLTDASNGSERFRYLVWALQQLGNIAAATNDSSRASHLFIAIEALFGRNKNSRSMWQSIPKQLFNHTSQGYEKIGEVMSAAYDCRNNLFHDGVMPPRRFYQRHFEYLQRLVIETAKWIVDNRHEPSLASKAGFITYVQRHRPQSIRAVLAREPFGPRL